MNRKLLFYLIAGLALACLAGLAYAAAGEAAQGFRPSERVPADEPLSFPADI